MHAKLMNGLAKTIRFLVDVNYDGHCYLLRRCLLGIEEKDGVRSVNGIVLPDELCDKGIAPRELPNNWGRILAAGRNCGKDCSDEHRKTFGWTRGAQVRLPMNALALVKHWDMHDDAMQNPIKIVGQLGLFVHDPPRWDYSYVLVEESRFLCVVEE